MIKSQTQGGRTVEEDDEAEDEARKGSNSGAVVLSLGRKPHYWWEESLWGVEGTSSGSRHWSRHRQRRRRRRRRLRRKQRWRRRERTWNQTRQNKRKNRNRKVNKVHVSLGIGPSKTRQMGVVSALKLSLSAGCFPPLLSGLRPGVPTLKTFSVAFYFLRVFLLPRSLGLSVSFSCHNSTSTRRLRLLLPVKFHRLRRPRNDKLYFKHGCRSVLRVTCEPSIILAPGSGNSWNFLKSGKRGSSRSRSTPFGYNCYSHLARRIWISRNPSLQSSGGLKRLACVL